MVKKLILILEATLVTMTMCSCGRDWYGDTFVKRELVTFHVKSDSGQPLNGVEVMTVEVDAFDNDPIIGRTQYDYTDADGFVTIEAVFDDGDGYSMLGERTNRFIFTATDYAVFDTIFNYWEGTVDIVLHEE